jgi:hypothetical protein
MAPIYPAELTVSSRPYGPPEAMKYVAAISGHRVIPFFGPSCGLLLIEVQAKMRILASRGMCLKIIVTNRNRREHFKHLFDS